MANVYTEVTAATSLNNGRISYNETMRALLTNFKDKGIPSTFTIDGVSAGIQDGMLYRSATTNALYIADSVYGISSPIGGTFTRKGIGLRTESSFTLLEGSATLRNLYEIGEIVGVLDTGKLYLKITNGGTSADFKDVSLISGLTIDGSLNASFTGPSLTVNKLYTTSNVGVGTSTPAQTLDVRGNVSISNNVYLGSLIYHNNDVTTYSGYPVSTTNTYVVATAGSERMRVDAAGNLGIGTTTAKSKLEVVGNAAISTSLYVPTITAGTALNVSDPTTQYNLNLAGNQINSPGYNGVASIQVNYTGYIAGTTQFRDFVVYNGKQTAIGTFTGSTGSLTVAGDVAAYSDARLKSNVETIVNAVDKVMKLRGVTFTKDDKNSLGVIAQEIEHVIPEVVSTAEYKSVAYGNLVGLLIEAIKELKLEIEQLKGSK